MTDLTDTEIVAACARAMGLKWIGHHATRAFREQESWAEWPDGTKSIYSPLTDRAQAMELVIWLLKSGVITLSLFGLEFNDRIGGNKFSIPWRAEETEILRSICLCAARVQLEKEQP